METFLFINFSFFIILLDDCLYKLFQRSPYLIAIYMWLVNFHIKLKVINLYCIFLRLVNQIALSQTNDKQKHISAEI